MKIFVFDYDDTVVDFDRSLRKVVAGLYNKGLQHLPVNIYEFLSHMGLNKKGIREFLLRHRHSLYLNLQPFPHCKKTLARIKKAGFLVYIITARPEKELKEVTLKNIKENGLTGIVDELIFTNYELKGRHIQRLQPAFFVDDQSKHLENAVILNSCCQYILFKYYYRGGVSRKTIHKKEKFIIAQDWFELETMLWGLSGKTS